MGSASASSRAPFFHRRWKCNIGAKALGYSETYPNCPPKFQATGHFYCSFISHYGKSNQGCYGAQKRSKIHRNTLVPQRAAETFIFKLAVNSTLHKENPRHIIRGNSFQNSKWSLISFSYNNQGKEPDSCKKPVTSWLRKAMEVCFRGEEKVWPKLLPGRASKSLEDSE